MDERSRRAAPDLAAFPVDSRASAGKGSVRKTTRSIRAEQAILKATLDVLMEGGYAALTIDRVAALAKASKTTIYRRWPTKEHLILAVFDQLPIATPADEGSFSKDLTAVFRQFERIMRDSPMRGVLPMLAAECVHNAALSGALIRVNEQRRAPMRVIVQRAVQRGELHRNVDVELAIDVIQGAILIRMYFLLDQLSPRWIRGLVQLLHRGFADAPERRSRRRTR
jgi:AcrR family transcriptional regulator